jgi:hypothetical protein
MTSSCLIVRTRGEENGWVRLLYMWLVALLGEGFRNHKAISGDVVWCGLDFRNFISDGGARIGMDKRVVEGSQSIYFTKRLQIP